MKQVKNYKDCFHYFAKKYKDQNGKDYIYFRKRLGIELVKIKRLKLSPQDFIKFINWLYSKRKLSSLNFLTGQLNDYYSSKEYKDGKEIQDMLLHYEVMEVKDRMIGKCKRCNGTGYLKNLKKCKCMIKFLKIREKMRKAKI